MNNYYKSKYMHQYYTMEVCNCFNDRQLKNNEIIYLYMIYLYKFPRNDITHHSSTNRISASINLLLKNIKHVEQN